MERPMSMIEIEIEIVDGLRFELNFSWMTTYFKT